MEEIAFKTQNYNKNIPPEFACHIKETKPKGYF